MKLGRLPAEIPSRLKLLTHYVAGDLPTAPTAVPVPSVPEWGMLGNDKYGCCGPAGLHHQMMGDASIASETEAWPTTDQLVSYYLAFTSGKDSGVALSKYLAYVRKVGYLGHSVDSFAPLDVHDIPTLQSAVWLFGGAYSGILVTGAMQRACLAGDPWTRETLVGPVLGGHCVPILGYDEDGVWVITWGRVQKITWAAWHYIAEESWAVITGEFVARNGNGRGVELGPLRADLDRLAA